MYLNDAHYTCGMDGFLIVSALGVQIAIDLAGFDADQRDAAARAWSDAATPTLGDDPPVDVLTVVGVTHDVPFAVAMERLSQQVTLAAIEARAGELWMLHAAAFTTADGRVIAFVAASGVGKTTAATVLGRHLGYVTDETVGIDATGSVWPYRKPLSVIERAGEPKAQHAPSQLRLRELPNVPLRLAAIVLLDRDPDAAGPARITSVTLADALAGLVPQSSYLMRMRTPLAHMVDTIAEVGGVLRATYREAEDLPLLIDAILAERPALSTVVTPAVGELSIRGGANLSRESADEVFQRAPFVDALETPDGLILLQPTGADGAGIVHVLAGIAPTLWQRAAHDASRGELLSAAEHIHGTRADVDTSTLVDMSIDELLGAGILQRALPRWKIAPDVAWVGDEQRVVAFALNGAEGPQAMEGTAAALWMHVASTSTSEPSSTGDIAAALAVTYGVAPDAVERDIAPFVADLAARGLIHPTS